MNVDQTKLKMHGSRDVPARTLEAPLKKAAAWATINAKHTTKIPALMLDKVVVPSLGRDWLQQQIPPAFSDDA